MEIELEHIFHEYYQTFYYLIKYKAHNFSHKNNGHIIMTQFKASYPSTTTASSSFFSF